MAFNYPNYAFNTGGYAPAYMQNSPIWNQNQQLNNIQQQTQQIADGSMMAVFVQGEAGANAYPVASGSTVLLIDFDSGKFWLKSNVNGIPQKLRTFAFSESTNEQMQNVGNQAVTREEFDRLEKSVNKLISELGGVVNE